MSASERLREMDRGMPHAPTHIATWPSFWELREALPLIVAVVEAAEAECAPKVNTPEKHRGGVAYWAVQPDHPIPGVQRRIEMARALAALDEALTPQAGGER